ncbi:hypothetical protein HaLaN_01289, partial [Haematococcus lacustris]
MGTKRPTPIRHTMVCDGQRCDQCRGALVFRVAALAGPGRAWRYRHQGLELDSDAPGQHIRGDWHVVHELHTLLGSHDLQLLSTALTHDRRLSYLVAVHLPAALVEGCMEGAVVGLVGCLALVRLTWQQQ